MPKVSTFFLILLVSLSLFATKVEAGSGQCTKNGKILAKATWPDSQSFINPTNITIDFTKDVSPGTYYVIFSNGLPFPLTIDYTSNKIALKPEQILSGSQQIFSINPFSRSMFDGINNDKYWVKLQKDGSGDACDPTSLGQINSVPVYDDYILKQSQCNISVPSNVQLGTSFTISQSAVNLTAPNIAFTSLIYKKSVFARLPTDIFTTTSSNKILFENKFYPKIIQWYQHNLAGDLKDVTYPTNTGELGTNADNYTAVIVVSNRTSYPGTLSDNTRLYICKSLDFSITSNPTTSPPSTNPISSPISAYNSPLTIGQTPQVILANAQNKSTYTFYWKGSAIALAAKQTVDCGSGNTVCDKLIPLNESGTQFKSGETRTICMEIGDLRIPTPGNTCTSSADFVFTDTPPATSTDPPTCTVIPTNTNNISPQDPISVSCKNLPDGGYFGDMQDSDGNYKSSSTTQIFSTAGHLFTTLSVPRPMNSGTYTVSIFEHSEYGKPSMTALWQQSVTIVKAAVSPTPGYPSVLPKTGGSAPTPTTIQNNFIIPAESAAGGLCDYDFSIGTFTAKSDLINNRNEAGLRTAIGCVPTKLTDLIAAILKFSLSIGGGIAFLLMVSGVFQMMTSAGNPDQLKNGSSMITNAIIGILFIIFSILFLQIIGTGILQIPGLS